MTTVELINPSAWRPIRIAVQDRVRNTFEKGAAPAPALKRDTHDTLMASTQYGREATTVCAQHGLGAERVGRGA